MEFRKGDVVSVEGVVDFITTNGKVYVKPNKGEAMAFEPEAIKLVQRQFAVGDDVDTRSPDTYLRGKIVDIRGDWAWVEGGGLMISIRVENLRMIEPPTLPIGIHGTLPPENFGKEVEYTVATGDTLEAIAQAFETSVDTIRIQNQITDPDLILSGQVLKITDNRIPF